MFSTFVIMKKEILGATGSELINCYMAFNVVLHERGCNNTLRQELCLISTFQNLALCPPDAGKALAWHTMPVSAFCCMIGSSKL